MHIYKEKANQEQAPASEIDKEREAERGERERGTHAAVAAKCVACGTV